jgi:hypothetical protein
MMANSVYSCDQLSDGSYVIGTVSNGFLFWPPKERLNIIFLKTKLSNNTVLSLFEDADKIFGWDWIMGSTALTFSLLLKKYVDDTGKLGTVYSSKLYDGRLYIGTNQVIL